MLLFCVRRIGEAYVPATDAAASESTVDWPLAMTTVPTLPAVKADCDAFTAVVYRSLPAILSTAFGAACAGADNTAGLSTAAAMTAAAAATRSPRTADSHPLCIDRSVLIGEHAEAHVSRSR